MHTIEEFKRDLALLGVKPGDAVMMHSSYRSLGGIEGGARALFDAMTELLGPEGTLMLPAFSYETVTREEPYFSVKDTPSCVGYLPEYFRTQYPGVIRSMHATHSLCACGKNARYLIDGHINDATPVGRNSPLAKLPLIGGKILILGCHPDHNTTLHGVEETIIPPYLFDLSGRVNYRMEDENGVIHTVNSLRHGFWFKDAHYFQRYSRITELLEGDEISRGKVLDADCILMSSEAVWRHGHEALNNDPFYFVDRIQH